MKAIASSEPRAYDALPRTWAKLIALHPLRPIHDEAELANATEVLEPLVGHDLNRDQSDFVDALATLIEAYESHHHRIKLDHITGLDALRSLLQDHSMSAADLARLLGVHRSHAAKIVQGERSLTVDHLRTLGRHFKVRPDLFM